MKPGKRLLLPLLAVVPAAVLCMIIGIGLLFVLPKISQREMDILSLIAHRNLAVLLLTGLAALATLISLTHYFIVNYFLPLQEISEEIPLIVSGNAKHRLQQQGGGQISNLIRTINQAAAVFEQVQSDITASVEASNKQHEKEKTILASLISQLESGVIVCNLEGLILLYNKRAHHFLAENSAGELGLGRSILGIFEKNILSHTLWDIKSKINQNGHNVSSVFLYVVGGQRTLRIRTVPIISEERKMQGYILLMRDLSEQVQLHKKQSQLITSLSEGLRGITANIRTAIETIVEFPKMRAKKRDDFHQAILNEVHNLSERIQQNTGKDVLKLKSHWALDDILLTDVLQIVRQMSFEQLEIILEIKYEPVGFWISADLYSLVVAMLFLLNKIKENAGVHTIYLHSSGREDFIKLEFGWQGNTFDKRLVESWNSELLFLSESSVNRTLEEVLNEHHAALWLQQDKVNRDVRLTLLLPVLLDPVIAPSLDPIDIHSTPPRFYDFDLFHQAGQSIETDDKPLSSLSYTVFDTETTGLDPSGGDEIISIGAVRIVNGRLLATETFDQLIDPGRTMTAESVKVHGITQDMLTGQPVAKDVLPRFFKFAKETILVAHNAAFDLKFLQMKEKESGVVFENPVLDTLLLSSIIHKNQKQHNLDALCQRFDVKNIGRHSALGDALATAEVFLKIIPFLEKAGIKTLKQAREASEKNFYNKIEY
ncbi:hypothetical protein KC799_03765 [candidate division KSB1 bacterium]|nr:hypothetical protein [candidate division KSB1 bacterium]